MCGAASNVRQGAMADDPSCNSITAANFLAAFIGTADVDFSGSSHFDLRNTRL